jgi:amino acid adenylation domain-containing protein
LLQQKARGLPAWIRRRDVAPDALSERHLAVAQAQLEAARHYTPRIYAGSVVLFRARVRQLLRSHDRSLGWDALVRGGVWVHAVGGGHDEILRQPYVRELADRLRPYLAAVPEAAGRFVRFEEADVEQSVAARFERQVELYPNQIAIKSETHELTYSQLNRLANRIAHAILAHSPDRGGQVGLLFRQQAPMIAASMGALKAGRTYVSLDPTYPRARQDLILSDAEVGIILTDADQVQQAVELADGRNVLDVGALDPNLSAEDPRLPISPGAFTYIVYTSGSTGQPKGVVENQRNVLHFTMNNTNTWFFGPDDRISLLVPYWFSASATATFGALLNGATLLPMNVKERGLTGLADWLEQQRITIFHTSTSLFRHFARSLPEGKVFPSVRVVYQGSEALFRSDVDLYKRHFAAHCGMTNSLGASEMKVFSSFPIDMQTAIDDRVVPVGYPVPGVEVFVVDEHAQPVEQGSVGEIVVRSCYIAPCYWRRPELTARAFRPDPTGGNMRLYYTGDLGRLDADGCLHHVGRKDFQVKIRGYRVELGAVTAALLELPEVAEATVIAQQSDDEGSRLVAYVVPAAAWAPNVAELRVALQGKVPSYMLPSVFITLGALPRNPNGKVDTAALISSPAQA